MLRSLIIPLMVIGLMSMSVGVVLADLHGGDGNATSNNDGLDPNATSTDPGLDDPNATSTDPIAVDDGAQRRSFPGTVYYLGDDMVTIANNGAMANVSLGDVEPKTPGGPNNQGTWGEEANVVVHAEWVDGQWVAKWVIVKPIKPTFAALVGTAISTEDGVTTILLPNGKTKKIKNSEGEEEPEDGEVVTVFVDESGDGESTGDGEENGDADLAKVTGLVKASTVSDRIQAFLENLAAEDESLPQAAIDARERLVANLAAVLERHLAQHVSIIGKASKAQGLGSGAAAGLERALEKALAGQAEGNAIADAAKSKVGLGQNPGKGAKNIFGPSTSGDGSDDDVGDDADSTGSGKPADAGSQGSSSGNKGNSGG